MQLEFAYWGRRTLRAAIDDYFARNCDGLAEGTIVDYRERAAWLLRELGDLTPLESINHDRLQALADKWRGSLANVTVKRRLLFLVSVLTYAQARELIPKVPMLPKLRNDGRLFDRLHTIAQWERFRGFVPPGRFRRLYDTGMLTGQHVDELMTMERWMLDAEHQWPDGQVGRFWRRNRKWRKCEPGWIPMQPELLALVPELLEDAPRRESLVIGTTWNRQRAFNMAADRATAAGELIERPTFNDLRRSFASLLVARGWSSQAVRLALGHAGPIPHTWWEEDSGRRPARLAERPRTAERHYIRATTGTFTPRG